MKLLIALLMVTFAALAQAPDLKSASGYPKKNGAASSVYLRIWYV